MSLLGNIFGGKKHRKFKLEKMRIRTDRVSLRAQSKAVAYSQGIDPAAKWANLAGSVVNVAQNFLPGASTQTRAPFPSTSQGLAVPPGYDPNGGNNPDDNNASGPIMLAGAALLLYLLTK